MVDCDHGGGGPAEADQGVGLAALRHCLRKEEELGFQSCEEAVLPERPTENVAGVNLFAMNQVVVPAGSYTLVRTGLKVQMPKEDVREDHWAVRGVEAGAAVIERDFGGEVRILVRNYGHADYIVKPGEAVAQMVLEKVSVARIKEVKSVEGRSVRDRGCGRLLLRVEVVMARRSRPKGFAG